MDEPICLIDTGRDGRMSVQQGALQVLEQIQQPVVVAAVVGLYRTGKSYLMNRLARKQRGFALGSTNQSKTKGIWMWGVPHPFKNGHTLVLLDTEGLGDVEKSDIEKEYERLLERNVSESHQVCSSVIARAFAPLEKALEDGVYMGPGGYQKFRAALHRGTQLYRSEKRKGVVTEEVLSKYLKEKNAVGRSILAVDRSLTQAQQKAEEGRMQQEEAEQRQKLLEHVNQIQQQMILDQQRSNEENIRQLEEKMEEERRRNQEELQQVLSAKLQEQKSLLERGFSERARAQEEDIRRLRQEHQSAGQKKPSFLNKLGSDMQTLGGAVALVAPGVGTIVGLGGLAVGTILKYVAEKDDGEKET